MTLAFPAARWAMVQVAWIEIEGIYPGIDGPVSNSRKIFREEGF